ncbi:uncharacterized protein LOC119164946 [Rhipicephalus microplus]|uniref:uncharacterized protein LOC119164946 n=1 Tax=Rhipicephalus microplus TaxID=6941 RepID=UPI003F6AA566
MPDNRRTRLYRLSGHAIGGVNWRRTRFAEDVPQTHVCCLCGTIPASTVLLPCSHLLCEPCREGSAGLGTGPSCPLDREPFDVQECHVVPMPTRKSSHLRAYCWNEAAGCGFVGSLDALLLHFERDCSFHVIECPRCDVTLLHKDLPEHCVTTCLAETASASTQPPPSQDQTLARHEFNAAVSDLKTPLIDHNQLPVMQSQLDEIVEHSKKQDAQVLEIARLIGDLERTLRNELAQLVGGVSSMSSLLENLRPDERQRDSSKEERFQKGPVDSSSGVTQDFIPWNMEKKLILRKLELLFHATNASLEDVRQGAHADQRTPTVICRPVGPSFCHVLNRTLSSSLLHGRAYERKTYLATVRNASVLLDRLGPCRKFATVTQCHDRDTYFAIHFSSGKRSVIECLILSIECGGFLESSHLLSAAFSVSVLHDEQDKDRPMQKLLSGFPFTGTHFKTKLLTLKSEGFLHDDEIKFEVTVS